MRISQFVGSILKPWSVKVPRQHRWTKTFMTMMVVGLALFIANSGIFGRTGLLYSVDAADSAPAGSLAPMPDNGSSASNESTKTAADLAAEFPLPASSSANTQFNIVDAIIAFVIACGIALGLPWQATVTGLILILFTMFGMCPSNGCPCTSGCGGGGGGGGGGGNACANYPGYHACYTACNPNDGTCFSNCTNMHNTCGDNACNNALFNDRVACGNSQACIDDPSCAACQQCWQDAEDAYQTCSGGAKILTPTPDPGN